jgi:hypothetical protein
LEELITTSVVKMTTYLLNKTTFISGPQPAPATALLL